MNGVIHRLQPVSLHNPHLVSADDDFMYHLGFSKQHDDLPKLFGNVKFVLCGGTASRMLKTARMIADSIPDLIDQDNSAVEVDLCRNSDRFSMFKVGPVLCVNHGMGAPSISIMLIELIKLLHYAHTTDVTIIRIGTCGGLGVQPGTTIVSTCALNGLLEPYYIEYVCGKEVRRPVHFDQRVIAELRLLADQGQFAHPVVFGKTFVANDFYEGQARLDGLFCDHSPTDKDNFFTELCRCGVVNIEMEALALGAITHRAKISACMISTTLLDRLVGDQVPLSDEQRHSYESRPIEFVISFIKRRLGIGVNK